MIQVIQMNQVNQVRYGNWEIQVNKVFQEIKAVHVIKNIQLNQVN